jgi:hypothetical protein
MWYYYWHDVAFDLVKGLVAGGASLALQVAAPRTFHALKGLLARRLARKADQERSATPRWIERGRSLIRRLWG